MTFLAPWLLWCVPLAGLPVLFHLFFKVKKRPLPFSSLMFFLKVEPNLQARRKIREILLLVLRCLLILLVVLALARPVFPAFGGGGRTALVLVVDNSASMGADGGGKPRLRQALEGASALLGELRPGDLAALVPAVDERTAVASGLGGDPAVVRAALDQVTATEAAADPGRALRQALALLATTPAPAREIHVFTDAQEGEWGRPAGEWGAVPPGVQVVVHRVATGPRPGADVAVAAVHPPLTRIIAGRPARSGVVLVNHGAEAATVQLRVTDDQGAETVRPVSVPAHGNVEVPVVLTPAQAGLHHALVRIEGDGFAGDDRAGLAFACGDRAAVLFSGDPRAYGLLPVALAPDGTGAISGLSPMAVPAADLEREIAERRPALVVLTWADLAARTVGDHPDLPAFKSYVGGGGALLVVPGVAGLEGGGVAPDWLGAAPTRDERLTTALPALVLAADAACFAEIRDGAGVVDVQGVRIARAVPLKVGTGRATFGLSDGRAVLVETAFGKGRVFTCGLAFHPAWSSLPLKGWSLAMVQGLALPPPLAADRVLRLTAGQGLPAGTTGVVRIATLAGGPGAWNGPADQAPVFARAGVYSLTAGDEPARIVTVAAAPGEGIPVYVEGPALPALVGLAQRVLSGGAAAAVADWRRSRRGSDLTPWCVVLAIMAWVAEGLIGTAGIAKPVAPAPGPGAALGRTPERDLVGSAAIFWLPQVPPLLLAAIVALLIVALVVADRRLRARLGAAGGWLLLAPRIGVAVLLVLALLDPTVRSEHRDSAHGRLALLIDTSSSMDVADDGRTPRLARARALAARIAAAAPSGVTVTTLAFDTRIRGALAAAYPPGERPGDPGVVLQGAAADPALAGAVAVVALTDGGDEPFTVATPPAVPLSIVGVGAPDGEALPGDNLAVAGVTAPATVEARLDFAIVADLAAQARSPAFAARLADVPVVLQRAEGAGWKDVVTLRAALANGRAQVTFAQTADSPGLRRYRVALPELPGELSLLDNTRALAIDVREQSLHVLFFTRELGADFKSLRQELARDPGVSFTGLFRITGDRYTLQGDRLDGDAALEKGFPTSAEALRRYGCVVLGAFPASGWSEAEMAALIAYVEQGGAAVFLGGERAFAAGGYATTPLAPLLPWNLSGAGGLLRGTFPVGVPATAGGQPAVAGLQALLAGAGPLSGEGAGGAVLESVNDVGPLRPGATALLESVVAGRPLAVAAIQPYGRGKSVGIATNTLWRLARAGGDGTTAYGRFWRQLVRHAADAGDASHLARVQWDRERYQPGDEAVATITVLAPPGAAPRLAATLAFAAAGATSETPVPLEAAAGQAGSLRARVRFGERGEYRFRLSIAQPGQADDTYEKVFAIAPRLGEGNRLAVDAAMLSAAAGAAGGVYAAEKDLEPLLAHLRTTLLGKPVTSDLALVGGDPWYLLAFLALVIGEWWLRRRKHLL